MNSVIVTYLRHKEKDCFAIGFPFSKVIKNKVLSIAGVHWSATHKTFYVSEEDLLLDSLLKALQSKGLDVDASKIQNHTVPASKTVVLKKSKRGRILSSLQKQFIREYVLYLRGKRLSESTVISYFNIVADFVSHWHMVPLTDLNNDHFRLFTEHQVKHKGYGISTHRQMVSAVRHLGTFFSNGHLQAADIELPKKSMYVPVVLSKEEIVDLLRATKNLKHRAVIALLYSSGLRIGELINLKLSCIDIDRRQLLISQSKGRKDRMVVLAESFIPLLKNYLLTYQPECFFIENPNGGKYHASSVRKFLKGSCRVAKISKKVTPHTLRHSFATHLVEQGIGLRYIQDLLGHAKPETTMIYTHIARKDLLEVKSPLDVILNQLSSSDKVHQKGLLSDNSSG